MRKTWVVEFLPGGRCRAVPVLVAGHLVSVGRPIEGHRRTVRRRIRRLERWLRPPR